MPACILFDFNPRTHRGVRLIIHLLLHVPGPNFNPRTHRGVRHMQQGKERQTVQFQSTHPSWGATMLVVLHYCIDTIFQSTHPSWGATKYDGRRKSTVLNFNPRTHRGVRLDIVLSWLTESNDFNPRTHRGVRRRRYM